MTKDMMIAANTCIKLERHVSHDVEMPLKIYRDLGGKSMEICRDLRRLAGLVNKFGWDYYQGRQPVGGTIVLCGPVFIYNRRPIDLGLPGYYSREQIQEAYEQMYGG